MLDLQAIKQLPPHQQAQLLPLIEELQQARAREAAQNSFLEFVKAMWPAFIEGRHHCIMADAIDRIISGDLKRLIVNIGPRFTKSKFFSEYLPAKYLGHYPDRKVIEASHTAELAVGFGRDVRNTVATKEYRDIFPGTKLSADAKAAGRWTTQKGGTYHALGIGASVAGKGADLFIVDDPHSEQDYLRAKGGDMTAFDDVYDWYTSGPRQRLQPNAAIVVVMCMTGETPVLLPDGGTRFLQDLRVGDEVATYEGGVLSHSMVLNWRSNGVDSVFKISTISGKVVRANERHPFLVDDNGDRKWVRLKELKPGMALVSLKDVTDPRGRKPDLGFVALAKQPRVTTRNIQMHRTSGSDGTASIRERFAQWVDAIIRRTATTCANPITIKLTGLLENLGNLPSKDVRAELNIDTASLWRTTKDWLMNKVVGVLYAGNSPIAVIPGRIGMVSYASTTVTRQIALEHFFAMTATSPSGMQKLKKQLWPSQNTSAFTADQIVEIVFDGKAEVFDVEIERTENFIANGIVSHNTRWNRRDLTGRLINAMTDNPHSDQWEIIEFPALMPDTDAPLWPEYWTYELLAATRDTLPAGQWNAQYLQNPVSEEGALIKREWWKIWDHDKPPPCKFVISAWDTAFLKGQRNDYSANTDWGVFELPDATGKLQNNIIVLDSFKERMEFPQLKKVAHERWLKRKPDAFIVEGKASGMPLIFELRAMGIPVSDFSPSRGTKDNPNDKIARTNGVSDLFSSGMVWRPQTRWAEELADEMASFPNGDHDDLHDSAVMALTRFRNGGFLRLASDDYDDKPILRRTAEYY